jgi:hypothetical protein
MTARRSWRTPADIIPTMHVVIAAWIIGTIAGVLLMWMFGVIRLGWGPEDDARPTHRAPTRGEVTQWS